jgi:alpha-L-arabinofuranosidase
VRPFVTTQIKFFCFAATLFAPFGVACCAEWHVATNGCDANAGCQSAPLRTIQHAAELAQPGDVVVVHAGVYRERINPPRGGTSDRKRIVYQAARGEKVAITGSETVNNWERVTNDTWKVTVANSFFGNFNPYCDLIHGDWFVDKGRRHHTGAVYLNGDWLTEAAAQDEVMQSAETKPLWFAEVNKQNTVIWAQFKGINPNEQRVEINVRQSVFYPDQPGRNFITVRGFTLCDAATPWSPPTAEQIGLIGTHWSKGWIIESNVIHHSTCVGITLGKHGDKFDNTSANSAEGYVKTIERAQNFCIAWTGENVGHHIVRNNTICFCEQAGIVGSLGAVFSEIRDNDIHDIHVRRLFSGAEQAGIKIHAAIDATISRNHVYRCERGLWLDWMAQGTRVSANLFYDNLDEDLFVEVDHGPFLVDNNVFLSPRSLKDLSEGGAYAHNFFGGLIASSNEQRKTPFHLAHSTAIAGITNITGGDSRFFNNVFLGAEDDATAAAESAKPRDQYRHGLSGYSVYDPPGLPLLTGGNVYYGYVRTYRGETNFVNDTCGWMSCKPSFSEDNGSQEVHFIINNAVHLADTKLVTSTLLGRTVVSGQSYVNPDGSEVKLDRDFFGNKRNSHHPTAGPFENAGQADLNLRLK